MDKADKSEEGEVFPEQNPYYNPPPYKTFNDLSGYQIGNRMDYLKFQVDVLDEAAVFEPDESKQRFLLEAVSNLRTERDALGEYSRLKIVADGLKEAGDNRQLHEFEWASLVREEEKRGQASKIVREKPEKKAGQRLTHANPIWDGVERRLGQPPLSDSRNRPHTNRKSKGLARTIHLSFNFGR
jgi:hypothetical protein